jgi:hypothetical protein
MPSHLSQQRQDPSKKPEFAYAALITAAIATSKYGRLPLNEIYTWIQARFPYYRHAPIGWKVR